MFSIRRVFHLVRLLAVAAVLTVTVAACGSADDAAPTTGATTTDEGETTEGETTEGETTEGETTEATGDGQSDASAGSNRTVEHALGTSEVPSDPQRIVLVDRRGTLAFLLELGFEPIGALDATWLFGEPFHPLIADRAEAAGVEPIDGTDGPNLEQIATLDPDVIIGNVRDMAETEEQLAEIAPTIGLEWDFADPLQNAIAIAEALGRTDEAQHLVEETERALDEAAAESADPGAVSIIGLFASDDIRIYRSANLYGRITEELGGEIVPTEEELALDPQDGEVNYVSVEQLELAAGERIISLVNRSSEEVAVYDELESEPLVQQLPAFRSGQVLEADPQLAFGAAGTVGVREMIDQLVAFYAN